jgi:YD repeat-containing protein
MKQQGAATTVYVYDASGQLAAEYSTQANQSPCATCYLTADHLGSTRLVTDQTGAIKTLHDFLPFGEEI